MRQVEFERPIVVAIAQTGIITTHRALPSNGGGSSSGCPNCGAAQAVVGGLLAGLLINKIAAEQQKNEQRFIEQMQTIGTALKDYDFDSSVAAATEKTVASVPWLGTMPIQISKEETNVSFNQLLESNESPQILVLRYVYHLVNELAALEVEEDIALLDKDSPMSGKPGRRASFDNAVFLRHIDYVVPLKMPQDDALTNARVWAQENARLLRNALDAVIAKSVTINAKAMTLTAEDAAALDARARTTEGNNGGAPWHRDDVELQRVVDKDQDGELVTAPHGLWTYKFSPVHPSSAGTKP
jgi:hypothetical protein